MPATTRLIGLLLMVIGIASYGLTGRTSITALIPAGFGVLMLACAWVARHDRARKHAMHAAVLIALVGVVGSLARALPAVADGQIARPAVVVQLVTAAVLGYYVLLGVQSFREARMARKG